MATESYKRNKNYQFWQYGNHAKEIYSDKFMWSKLDYKHMNPVRSGIVEKASHYLYSSAGIYVNNKGLLKVEVMPNPVVDVLKRESILRYDKH